MTHTRVEANQHRVITAERMVWPIEIGLSEPQSDSNSHILSRPIGAGLFFGMIYRESQASWSSCTKRFVRSLPLAKPEESLSDQTPP